MSKKKYSKIIDNEFKSMPKKKKHWIKLYRLGGRALHQIAQSPGSLVRGETPQEIAREALDEMGQLNGVLNVRN